MILIYILFILSTVWPLLFFTTTTSVLESEWQRLKFFRWLIGDKVSYQATQNFHFFSFFKINIVRIWKFQIESEQLFWPLQNWMADFCTLLQGQLMLDSKIWITFQSTHIYIWYKRQCFSAQVVFDRYIQNKILSFFLWPN